MSDLRATFLDRLRDPRAIPILARHAIPILGVFVFDWSVLETVVALLLDAVSTLWLVAAMGSYFGAKQLEYGETGLLNALHFWAGVLGIFMVVASLLTFAVLVPASFLLTLVGSADVDLQAFVTSGWAPRTFGFMLLCQLPNFIQRIRTLEAAGIPPEKMGMDAETGFVLHRTIMLAMMASTLAIFGHYALHALVIVAQTLGAGSEIMRDHYIGYLMASRRSASTTGSAVSKYRRRRKQR